MEPLRVLIVDDEELARLRLRSLLDDCVSPPGQVVGEAAHAAQALQWLSQQRADVLLLDIHMPGLDGMQLARRLQQTSHRPAVVFVTAHAEHALQAFEVQAIDYLTKPVRRARLQEALARAAAWLERDRGSMQPAAAPWPASAGATVAGPVASQSAMEPVESAGAPVLVVTDRGERVRVPLSEVLYLKAEQKYVTLRTARRSWLLDDSLAELEARLEGQPFVRIHRNALVALHAVQSLERHRGAEPAPTGFDADAPATDFGAEGPSEAGGWAVHIAATGEWLAVSRRQLAQVRSALDRL